MISFKEQDWDNKNWQNDTAMFIVSKIHPTKAKIVAALLKKYEGTEIDTISAITDYAERYYENFYYIITPFYLYEPEILRELCNQGRFVSILKKYLKKRHLGKHLDRVIKTFSKLEPQLKDKIFDDEVMSVLVEKCNDKKFYLNSKVFLFRAMYRISPLKAHEFFKKLNIDAFIDSFNNIPESGGGVVTFRKFMEIFKNLQSFYLFSIDSRFKEKLDISLISDDLTKIFSDNGYSLSDRAAVKKVKEGRWKVIDGKIAYLIWGKKTLNVHLSFTDDKDREALVINATKEILDGCYEGFIKRFENHERILIYTTFPTNFN